jgi:PEGA domain
MFRFMKLPAIALLALLVAAPVASAQRRGTVVVRPAFGFRYGPAWYGPGWYGPGWYGPYWARRYPYGAAGYVKIKTHMKDASVYVDGGYAGPAHKLKNFALRPGQHNIELRDPDGRTFYQERITVIAGKTIEIRPENQARSG